MFKKVGIVALGVIASASLPLVANAVTMEDMIRAALQFHPGVRSSEARHQSAEQRVRVERGELFPSVTLEGSTGYGYSNETSRDSAGNRQFESIWLNSVGVRVRQLVYDGGTTRNLVQQARLLSEAARGRIEVARQNVALQAIAAYIDVRRNRELVEIAQENVGAHTGILDSVSRLVQRGRARGSDRRQAEARLAQAQANLETRIGELNDAIARFRETVGQDVPEVLEEPRMPEVLSQINLDERISTAVDNNPEVEVADDEVQARQHAYDATRGLFLPNINLEFSVSRTNDDTFDGADSEIRVMMIATWNLYRGGSDTARRREAMANLYATQHDADDARRIVRQRVRQSYAALSALRALLGPVQTRVDSNRTIVRAYREQFQLGQRTLLDVLDQQNDLFVSRAQLADTRHTMIFNYFALLQATGELLAVMGIEENPESMPAAEQ